MTGLRWKSRAQRQGGRRYDTLLKGRREPLTRDQKGHHGLQQPLFHHLARHIGESKVAALMAVRELEVIEAEKVQ